MPKWTKIEDDYIIKQCKRYPDDSANKTILRMRRDIKTIDRPEFKQFWKRKDASLKERIYFLMGPRKVKTVADPIRNDTEEDKEKEEEVDANKNNQTTTKEEPKEEEEEEEKMQVDNMDQDWRELEEHLETVEKLQQTAREVLPVVAKEDKCIQTDDEPIPQASPMPTPVPVNPDIMFVFGKWRPRIYMNFLDFLDINVDSSVDIQVENNRKNMITEAKSRVRKMILGTAPDKNPNRKLTADEVSYNIIAALVYKIFSHQQTAEVYMELLRYNYVPHGGFNTDHEVMEAYLHSSQEYLPDMKYFVSVKQIADAREAAAQQQQQNSIK